MHICETLEIWADQEPRRAAEQMAVDEALLLSVERPVLRTYCWASPAVTFGYFQTYAEVVPLIGGRDVSRRWTGGGMVEHGEDLTYSIVFPSTYLAAVAIRSLYRDVHSALLRSMQSAGVSGVEMVSASASATRGGECFRGASACDLMVGNKKIAGAALKRTRCGTLGQGSVHLDNTIRAKVRAGFVSELAGSSGEYLPTIEVGVAARRLASEKYGRSDWLRLR